MKKILVFLDSNHTHEHVLAEGPDQQFEPGEQVAAGQRHLDLVGGGGEVESTLGAVEGQAPFPARPRPHGAAAGDVGAGGPAGSARRRRLP